VQRSFHKSPAALCFPWVAVSAGWRPGEYAYFVTNYRFAPANLWRGDQLSSEHLFVWPADKPNRLFYSKAKFSIHALTVVHLLV